ncbi:MAG: hypothetical protein RLZZ196_49 [Bacteroidota bacterium]|jgi:hypothetical protein
MALSVFPEQASLIKSVQRGSAASSGNITISSIDVSKAFVNSFSNSSSGIIATNSSTSGTYTPSGGNMAIFSPNFNPGSGSYPNLTGTRTFSGGTTSLTSGSFGAYILNSTTITVSGACYWQVVEYA